LGFATSYLEQAAHIFVSWDLHDGPSLSFLIGGLADPFAISLGPLREIALQFVNRLEQLSV
jgi:hypothetical protein